MYISKIRVKNYKSFLDSGDIHFEPGINIITGQNNGGKSALLNALTMRISDNPHMSTLTKPDSITTNERVSALNFHIKISSKELFKYISSDSHQGFLLKHGFLFQGSKHDSLNEHISSGEFFKDEYKNVVIVYSNDKITEAYLSIDDLARKSDEASYYVFNKASGKVVLNFSGDISRQLESMRVLITRTNRRIYLFKAERLNISMCAFGTKTALESNAQNLPEVLDNLQRTKGRFQKYHEYVKKVLPQIAQFTVKSANNNKVEIVVWNDSKANERMDLAIPLSECGTGVSQVMAILYVVLTAELPQVIIIDEPNSFLHPGAARKLIEVLKEYPQHQYIISTHSPETIAAANPKTIHIVRMENAQSIVEAVDITNVQSQQMYLAEIGAKLSDVFGADDILWVEGKTEEICFPRIIDKTSGLSLQGTSVLSIKHTGDFENSKMAKTTFEIYTKLSTGKGLIPPAIGFFFDREDRSKTEMEDLQRQARTASGIGDNRDMIVFTKRKMFENYLLDSNAIAEVLKSEGETSVTKTVIDEWLEENRWDSSFIKDKAKNITNWVDNVDGAKLLNKLFNKVSETRVKFDKIKHSVALCEWLIEHKIDALDDIVEMLKGFLKKD